MKKKLTLLPLILASLIVITGCSYIDQKKEELEIYKKEKEQQLDEISKEKQQEIEKLADEKADELKKELQKEIDTKIDKMASDVKNSININGVAPSGENVGTIETEGVELGEVVE